MNFDVSRWYASRHGTRSIPSLCRWARLDQRVKSLAAAQRHHIDSWLMHPRPAFRDLDGEDVQLRACALKTNTQVLGSSEVEKLRSQEHAKEEEVQPMLRCQFLYKGLGFGFDRTCCLTTEVFSLDEVNENACAERLHAESLRLPAHARPACRKYPDGGHAYLALLDAFCTLENVLTASCPPYFE